MPPLTTTVAVRRALGDQAERLIRLGIPEPVAVDVVAHAMATGIEHALERLNLAEEA